MALRDNHIKANGWFESFNWLQKTYLSDVVCVWVWRGRELPYIMIVMQMCQINVKTGKTTYYCIQQCRKVLIYHRCLHFCATEWSVDCDFVCANVWLPAVLKMPIQTDHVTAQPWHPTGHWCQPESVPNTANYHQDPICRTDPGSHWQWKRKNERLRQKQRD